MSKEPKKVDRRKFIYAGLGAVAVAALGSAAYLAARPPEVRTVTATIPTTQVVTSTVEKPVERTLVTTVSGTPTTIVQTSTQTSTIVQTQVQTQLQTVTQTVSPAAPKLVVWQLSAFAEAINSWLKSRILEWGMKRGVNTEVTFIPYAEFITKLAAAVEAGTPPDVAWNYGLPIVGRFAENPKARHLIPLDDVINELGKDDIYPSILRHVTLEEKLWGLPTFWMENLMHWRTDVAEEIGFKKAPDTWDDLLEWAELLKEKKPGAIPFSGFTLGTIGDAAETWEHLWWPMGGGLITKRSVDGNIYKSQATYDTAQTFLDFWNKGYLSPAALVPDDFYNNNNYLTEQPGLTIEGPTPYLAAVNRNPSLAGKTKLLPPPAGPKGRFTWSAPEYYVVFKESKNIDLAKDMLIYMMKDKATYTTGLVQPCFGAAVPIYKSVLEAMVKAAPDFWNPIIEAAKTGVMLSHPLNEPCIVGDEISHSPPYMFTDVFKLMFQDKVDPVKAVDTVATKVEAVFKRVYG